MFYNVFNLIYVKIDLKLNDQVLFFPVKVIIRNNRDI